jgi:predicted LPLAT superfamily acyltransferase
MSSQAKDARRVASEIQQAEGQTWLTRRERGTTLGIRFVFFLATFLGRFPARQFVRLVALYYALFDRNARRASRSWLTAVHQSSKVRWGQIYQHIFRFAQVTVDRIFLLKGATTAFKISQTGNEHLRELAQKKRGAILVGAHLGSFEAMRASASVESFPIHIVGHFKNAKMINALIGKLDPNAAARVLHVGEDPVGFALKVKERLAEGHSIAILADRVGLNEKTIEVDFFGKPASFSSGPFMLASAMRCPVYLVFGLYFEPNEYRLFCEPFCESLKLPRSNRQAALKETVQRYAARLEHYCRLAPDNWFNFYDFWKEPPQ